MSRLARSRSTAGAGDERDESLHRHDSGRLLQLQPNVKHAQQSGLEPSLANWHQGLNLSPAPPADISNHGRPQVSQSPRLRRRRDICGARARTQEGDINAELHQLLALHVDRPSASLLHLLLRRAGQVELVRGFAG